MPSRYQQKLPTFFPCHFCLSYYLFQCEYMVLYASTSHEGTLCLFHCSFSVTFLNLWSSTLSYTLHIQSKQRLCNSNRPNCPLSCRLAVLCPSPNHEVPLHHQQCCWKLWWGISTLCLPCYLAVHQLYYHVLVLSPFSGSLLLICCFFFDLWATFDWVNSYMFFSLSNVLLCLTILGSTPSSALLISSSMRKFHCAFHLFDPDLLLFGIFFRTP